MALAGPGFVSFGIPVGHGSSFLGHVAMGRRVCGRGPDVDGVAGLGGFCSVHCLSPVGVFFCGGRQAVG